MRRALAAAVFLAVAAAYAALRPSPSPAPLPRDARALAARLAAHPVDWRAASALAERSLDAPARDPRALWHATGETAIALAPLQPEPRATFARAAFFHWNELDAADRKMVLDRYAPVLSDAATFGAMLHPLYELTGDFDYLRRAAPRDVESTRALADVAATDGRFEDYRALRAPEARTPPPLKPDAWSGLCDQDVCFSAWREVQADQRIDVTLQPTAKDEVPPYVEIYVDGVRRAEGIVDGARTYAAAVAAPGAHLVEVRVANPHTRNFERRRVRITATQAL